MTDQRVRVVSYVVAVGAGVLVGGLFAPRAGDASRKLIAKKAQRVKKVVKGAVDDGSRFISRGGIKVRNQAGELLDRGKGVYRIAEKMVHAAL